MGSYPNTEITRGGIDNTCGKVSYNQCEMQEFERPRFFAGQLLTEDDLQQLTNYVVGKNRLSNRYLFGDGVACGLDVEKHPCDEGVIIIDPGYALDCCGNDVLLHCRKELDINVLARELRTRQADGYDCGDPCDKNGEGGEKAKKQRYYIYARYCEEGTQPITPYTTDGSCGAPNCEPSRIGEGVTFELRCYEPPVPASDICEAICDCKTDTQNYATQIASARKIQDFAQRLSMAVSDMASGAEAARFSPQHNAQLNQVRMQLEQQVAALQVGTDAEKKTAQLQQALKATEEVTGLVTRYRLSLANPDAAVKAESAAATEDVSKAVNTLSYAKSIYDKEKIESLVKNDAELEKASTIIKLAADKGGSMEPLKWDTNGKPDLPLLASGLAITPTRLQEVTKEAELLQQAAIQIIQASTGSTNQSLLQNIQGIIFVKLENKASLTQADIKAYSAQLQSVANAVLSAHDTCVCKSINPPCQPCDDPVVLLAAIEVEDCVVTNICNHFRKYLITPSSIRYWFPQVAELEQELREDCCPPKSTTGETVSFRDNGFLENLMEKCSELRCQQGDAAYQSQSGFSATIQQSSKQSYLTGAEYAPLRSAVSEMIQQQAAQLNSADIGGGKGTSASTINAALAEHLSGKTFSTAIRNADAFNKLEKMVMELQEKSEDLDKKNRSLEKKNKKLEDQTKELEKRIKK